MWTSNDSALGQVEQRGVRGSTIKANSGPIRRLTVFDGQIRHRGKYDRLNQNNFFESIHGGTCGIEEFGMQEPSESMRQNEALLHNTVRHTY
jgi:hypothetical protein